MLLLLFPPLRVLGLLHIRPPNLCILPTDFKNSNEEPRLRLTHSRRGVEARRIKLNNLN
jgi:hypothetical protein